MIGQITPLLALATGLIVLCIFATCNTLYYTGRNRPSQWWLAVLLPCALLAAAGHLNWATRVSGFQVFDTPSSSMENTVMMGNRVMVDRWYYTKNPPADGDIVVFMNSQGLYLMKRVIARGGETIESRDGRLSVEGRALSEPYVVHSGNPPLWMNNFGPIKVPRGELFVMGDNRDLSYDSRAPEIGPVDVNSLRGKPLYTVPRHVNDEFKIIR